MAHGPQPRGGDHRASILLVEDTDIVRRSTQELLEAEGCAVTLAGDGAAAITSYAAAPSAFDVVLLDMTLPGLSGLETLRALEALDPTVRVVLTSGYRLEAADAVTSERVVFLPKPFVVDELMAAITRLLGRGGGRGGPEDGSRSQGG